MTQYTIPCALYRGGTSRGLFFHKHDLPEDIGTVHKIFLTGIDAYNASQIDGVGSGTSHSSKVCVISGSSKESADVDFTFYQIGIGEEIVDQKGTCGNLMAAVGAFAVDEGYVDVSLTASQVKVSVFNTNINKMLHISVPVENGKAKAGGEYLMPGLVKSGAKFAVNILNPGGAKTGSTLPLELIYTVTTQNSTYEVSFLDVVNPFVFVSAKDLGIKGTELNSELTMNRFLMDELDDIRVKLAVAAGMSKTEDEARLTPSIPKIAIVSEPQDYVTSAGKLIKAEEVDIVAKMISMGNFHRTFAGSGLNCLGSAALLPGTLPNRFARSMKPEREQTIRIGQPEGVTEVRVALTEDKQDVSYVGMDRTARRILKGDLYIPEQTQ